MHKLIPTSFNALVRKTKIRKGLEMIDKIGCCALRSALPPFLFDFARLLDFKVERHPDTSSRIARQRAASRAEPMLSETSNTIRRFPVYSAQIMKILFVWDFDWTVINCNSDEYVPAQFLGHDATSNGFRDLIRTAEEQTKAKAESNHDNDGDGADAIDWDWHKIVEIMVGRAMQEGNGGAGATPDDILAAAAKMPYLDQIKAAIVEISQQGQTGQMILSDGNTLFIEAYLKANGMEGCFNEGIMTNIGEFVSIGEEGKPALRVTHQSAKYGGHDCARCARSPNLCKTQALNDKLGQLGDNAPERIVYVGDGANDACPALNILREGDVLLARGGVKRLEANGRSGAETDEEAKDRKECSAGKGGKFGIMSALKHAEREEGGGGKIPECSVMEWTTGKELRDLIREIIFGDNS